MLKTRMCIDHGGDINVRESVDEVAEKIVKKYFSLMRQMGSAVE